MLSRIFNSSLYLLGAYFIVHVVYLFVKYLAVLLIGAEEANLFFTSVYFDSMGYQGWSKIKIFLVYGFPSFVILLFGLVLYFPFVKISKDNSRLKLFVLWIMVLCLSFFISDFAKAPFVPGTINSVYMWLRFGNAVALLFAFVFIAALPFVGFFTAREVIKTSNSREHIRSRMSRVLYFLKVMMAPLFIVLLLIVGLFALPGTYPLKAFLQTEALRFVTLFVILLFGAYFSHTKKYVNIRKSSNLSYIKKEVTALSIFTMIFVYVLLYGIQFTS